MQTEHQAQKGRLPGPVRAEQAQHTPRLHFQGDIIERDLAVLIDLGELERFHHQVVGVIRHEAPSSTAKIRPRIIRRLNRGS